MNTTNRDRQAELPATWAAFEKYKANIPEINAIWDSATAENALDVIVVAQERESLELQLVRDALWDDTQTYNRREDVDAMRIQDIQAFFAQS